MQPVLLVVTDGEPTAHLLAHGESWFAYPPDPETIRVTVAELDRLGRTGTQATFFGLATTWAWNASSPGWPAGSTAGSWRPIPGIWAPPWWGSTSAPTSADGVRRRRLGRIGRHHGLSHDFRRF